MIIVRDSHTRGRTDMGWLHIARGIVCLNDDELHDGDGAKIEGEPSIELDTGHRAKILLFDLK